MDMTVVVGVVNADEVLGSPPATAQTMGATAFRACRTTAYQQH